MLTSWPDSATCWRDKRVIVTGPSAALRTSGSGFLGSFVVDKLGKQWAVDWFEIPGQGRHEDAKQHEALASLLFFAPSLLRGGFSGARTPFPRLPGAAPPLPGDQGLRMDTSTATRFSAGF